MSCHARRGRRRRSCTLPRLSAAARCRALDQVGGREPDRIVQGSRHGGRRLARARARRAGHRLRVDREHRGVRGRLRGARRPARRRRARAAAASRAAKVIQARRSRRRAPRDRRQLRRRAPRGAAARRGRRARATSTRSIPTASRDRPRRRVEVRRAARRPPRRARAAVRRGRQHVSYARGFGETALPRFVLGEAAQRRRHVRERDPDRRARAPASEVERRARALRRHRSCRCRRSEIERRVALARREEGIFCEPASAAGIAAVEARSGCVDVAGRLRRHAATASRTTDAVVSVEPSASAPRPRRRTSAPASTAPAPLSTSGTSSSSRPPATTRPSTATISACAPSSASFPPSAGASASPTAFRRHAGSARAPRWSRSGSSRRRSSAKLEPTADELLALGIELEGHGDNLAAALTGGVCLTWGTRIARIADTDPGNADRRHSGAPGRDGGIQGRAPGHRPARRRRLLRRTRRAARRRAGEQLGRPLRGSPGRPAARALPRRELPAPRRGSRAATRAAHWAPPSPAPARR